MKKNVSYALIVVASMLLATACTKVEPGYTGIRVNLYGSNRGVSDYPIVTGRVWYSPWSEEIYQYPTFVQNVIWSSNPNEGASYDESFTANSSEGTAFHFNVGAAYQIDQAMVPHIFVKYREDARTLTRVFLYNAVRGEFANLMSQTPIMQLMGSGRAAVEKEVLVKLNQRLEPDGIHFAMINIIGQIQPDNDQVTVQINNVIAASQRAQAALQKVAQAKAEAEQAVATADGEAQSNIARANGEAQATLLKAKAQADANRLLSQSLTPELIEYRKIDRWNGDVPTTMLGNGTGTFLQIPMTTQQKNQ